MTINKNQLFSIKNKPPLFIVGCQRSGTSFLYRTLSNTIDIGFGRDNTLFMNIYKKIDGYGDLSSDSNLKSLLADIEQSPVFQKRFKKLQINNDDFISCIENRTYNEVIRTIYALWALQLGKEKWGGKTPDYTSGLNFLIHMFPDTKIINMVRDGRDVALSFFQLDWGPENIFMAAHYWKKRIIKALSGKSLPENYFIEIKYEDLLQKPEETFNILLDFIGYKDEEKRNAIIKFRQQVIPNIKYNNFFKWKKYLGPDEVKIFEIVAGNELAYYDYDINNKNYRKLELSFLTRKYYYLNNIVKKLQKYDFKKLFRKRAFKYKY